MNRMQKLMATIRLLKDTNMKPNYLALSRTYGYDRRTIKKYFESGKMPKRKKKNEFSQWDPYEETISQKLSIPGATIKGLHEYFRETLGDDDLPGTYSSLKAYIRKKGFRKNNPESKKPHVHFETEKGQQIQADWIEGLSLRLRSGEEIKFNIYSATLGWSREHIFIYSPSLTTEDFIRCTLDAYRKLGGVTDELLTDNMSALVSVRNGKKKVNAKASQFFKDIGVELKLCKVRSPQTKGKDESANRFRSWLLPYNDELEDEEDVRNLVDEILTRRVNDKVNESTGLPPTVLFQKEKEYLKPLPNKVLLDSYLEEHIIRTVPSTLLVTFRGKGYSVPKKYINSRVHLYAVDDKLYIYDDRHRLITIHSISESPKNYHYEHYKEGLAVKGRNDADIEELARKNLERFDALMKEKK